MRTAISLIMFAAIGVIAVPALAGDGQTYKVELNKTEIVRLSGPASSIIVGNPKIADITVQSVDTIFVVGRGYGETNLIILDAQGDVMLDADLQVVNSLPAHGVRLYNAKARETYSCIPYCGPSPVLGDDPIFIGANTSNLREIETTIAGLGSLSAEENESGLAEDTSSQSGASNF